MAREDSGTLSEIKGQTLDEACARLAMNQHGVISTPSHLVGHESSGDSPTNALV